MAQYQSFPDAAGDSRTLEKLKALRMPDLAGRSFLDVGCNEGFFCGFAKYLGAERVVGIDQSIGFTERARSRFPDCEFLTQSWEELPAGNFDVILLASALHYADDQEALLHRLVERLTPDGVLVVELGIFASQKSEWVKVKRGIDERNFATMPKLREVLADYAWKWMGPSVTQAGDPVPRHVIHISRRMPVAYLLLQPPAYGKTSIAQRLFSAAQVPVVSGDQQIGLVAQGKASASPALKKLIDASYTPFTIDQVVKDIFNQGLGSDLVSLWIAAASKADFALDVYVPGEYHSTVQEIIREAGYLPVGMSWERPGPGLLSSEALSERGETFYLSMLDRPADAGNNAPGGPAQYIGFVDEVGFGDGGLLLRGWCSDPAGQMPPELKLVIDDESFLISAYKRQLRPDVQAHLSLPHALVGYVARVNYGGSRGEAELKRRISMFAARDGEACGAAFRIAGRP